MGDTIPAIPQSSPSAPLDMPNGPVGPSSECAHQNVDILAKHVNWPQVQMALMKCHDCPAYVWSDKTLVPAASTTSSTSPKPESPPSAASVPVESPSNVFTEPAEPQAPRSALWEFQKRLETLTDAQIEATRSQGWFRMGWDAALAPPNTVVSEQIADTEALALTAPVEKAFYTSDEMEALVAAYEKFDHPNLTVGQQPIVSNFGWFSTGVHHGETVARELSVKLQNAVDFMAIRGLLEDGCYTFGDGDTWKAGADAQAGVVVHRSRLQRIRRLLRSRDLPPLPWSGPADREPWVNEADDPEKIKDVNGHFVFRRNWREACCAAELLVAAVNYLGEELG